MLIPIIVLLMLSTWLIHMIWIGLQPHETERSRRLWYTAIIFLVAWAISRISLDGISLSFALRRHIYNLGTLVSGVSIGMMVVLLIVYPKAFPCKWRYIRIDKSGIRMANNLDEKGDN